MPLIQVATLSPLTAFLRIKTYSEVEGTKHDIGMPSNVGNTMILMLISMIILLHGFVSRHKIRLTDQGGEGGDGGSYVCMI